MNEQEPGEGRAPRTSPAFVAADDALPRYDRRQTYRWNYDHAPDPVDCDVDQVPGRWTFCGIRVDSPLGVPAGPLLNGRWILYYASLGFDVLTYKTVRSIERECYPLPNLEPVITDQLVGDETDVPGSAEMLGSWAVSFGMPSTTPDAWRSDVEWTRNRLSRDKVLTVSVVGSVQPDWTLDDLADDYALCARWAVESGADCIETNFSCPNVSTCDGQLYQQADAARVVASRVRDAIGDVPYIVKIGHVRSRAGVEHLLDAIGPHINALAMTNSVAASVRSEDGSVLFDGERRGICGDAVRTASLEQTRLFGKVLHERKSKIEMIGVGGASTAEHVRSYLEAGAKSVHIATAAMVDPLVACRIRHDLARSD